MGQSWPKFDPVAPLSATPEITEFHKDDAERSLLRGLTARRCQSLRLHCVHLERHHRAVLVELDCREGYFESGYGMG